jgi:hypothetical protein
LIADLTLTGYPSAWISVEIESELLGGHCHTGLICDPPDDLFQRGPQRGFVKMALIAQREVQILRKAVRFEITLFEIGAALENPRFGKFFV